MCDTQKITTYAPGLVAFNYPFRYVCTNCIVLFGSGQLLQEAANASFISRVVAITWQPSVLLGFCRESVSGVVSPSPGIVTLRELATIKIFDQTRSTIEVAHFRYFVSERRGSLTHNLDFEKKRFVGSGHGIIRCDVI